MIFLLKKSFNMVPPPPGPHHGPPGPPPPGPHHGPPGPPPPGKRW